MPRRARTRSRARGGSRCRWRRSSAIVIVLVAGYTGTTAAGAAPGGVGAIGRLLFTDYLFPFEVTSLLLLAALVGALTLAKRRERVPQ